MLKDLGDQSKSLLRGLGHVRGRRNCGAWARSDWLGTGTLFASFTQNRPGNGYPRTRRAYYYVVDSTEIVMPEEVEVLSVRSRPELTLITCYPFNYVGAAPKRFIVHAYLVSVAPDAVAAMHTAFPPISC
jgi:sortase A